MISCHISKVETVISLPLKNLHRIAFILQGEDFFTQSDCIEYFLTLYKLYVSIEAALLRMNGHEASIV